MTKTQQLRELLPKLYERFGAMNARMYGYQAIREHSIVGLEKCHSDWNLINRVLVELRETGVLPWDAVLDSKRDFLSTNIITISPKDHIESHIRRLRSCADYYYLPTWLDQPYFPVIVLEKVGMEAFFKDLTRKWDVPIYCLCGQAGSGHLHEVFAPFLSRVQEAQWCPILRLFYFGDADDEGWSIEQNLVRQLAKNGLPTISIERLALTKAQVEKYDADEIEVLTPDELRQLVEGAIKACWSQSDHEKVELLTKHRREAITRKIGKLTKGWRHFDE
jgi:hypothetical protein